MPRLPDDLIVLHDLLVEGARLQARSLGDEWDSTVIHRHQSMWRSRLVRMFDGSAKITPPLSEECRSRHVIKRFHLEYEWDMLLALTLQNYRTATTTIPVGLQTTFDFAAPQHVEPPPGLPMPPAPPALSMGISTTGHSLIDEEDPEWVEAHCAAEMEELNSQVRCADGDDDSADGDALYQGRRWRLELGWIPHQTEDMGPGETTHKGGGSSLPPLPPIASLPRTTPLGRG